MTAVEDLDRGTFVPCQGRGLVYVDEQVAAAYAQRVTAAVERAVAVDRRQHVLELAEHIVETELGPAVLWRTVEQHLTGGAS